MHFPPVLMVLGYTVARISMMHQPNAKAVTGNILSLLLAHILEKYLCAL